MRMYFKIGLAVLALGTTMLVGCSSEPKADPTPAPPPVGGPNGPQAAPVGSQPGNAQGGGAKPMAPQ